MKGVPPGISLTTANNMAVQVYRTETRHQNIVESLPEWPAVLRAAQSGDSEAFATLFRLYRPRVFSIARQYFVPGWDRDDLLQEGTIGFFKAVRDFRYDRGGFDPFMALCVRRQVITFLKTATRQKHAALNHACSLDAPAFSDSDEPLITRLPSRSVAAAEDHDDNIEFLKALWDRCSAQERGVLTMYSKGYSFEDMAVELGVRPKSIDNAVWRVKVKARKLAGEKPLPLTRAVMGS